MQFATDYNNGITYVMNALSMWVGSGRQFRVHDGSGRVTYTTGRVNSVLMVVCRTPRDAAIATPPWFVDKVDNSLTGLGRARSSTFRPSTRRRRMLTESSSCHVSETHHVDRLVAFRGDDVVDFPGRRAHVHAAEHELLCDR